MAFFSETIFVLCFLIMFNALYSNCLFSFCLEINSPYTFTILVSFFLVLFLARQSSRKSETRATNRKLPPGPRQFPLIGNLYHLATAGSQPHHSLRNLAKKYGPLMHLRLGQVPTIVVSSPEIASEILNTHDTIFAYRPALLVPTIITYQCEGIPVNLSEKIPYLTIGVAAGATFGKKTKDESAFIKVVKELNSLVSGFCLADLYPSVKVLQLLSGLRLQSKKIHCELDRILGNIVNNHKERRAANKLRDEDVKEDLVDVLLRLQKNGESTLTDSSIKAVIMGSNVAKDIFTAGGDTSATTVDWAMAELMKNPSAMRQAQAEVRGVFKEKRNVDESGLQELKYLKSVIKESLRLHPPVPLLIPRECSKNCEINGYKIAAKTRVIVNAWVLGRDPCYWAKAEEFQPERFLNSPLGYTGTNFKYIPFGAERRICPGVLFAQPNIELQLANLLFHFNWKLPRGLKPEDLDMSEDFGLVLKKKNAPVLVPTPYQTMSAQ